MIIELFTWDQVKDLAGKGQHPEYVRKTLEPRDGAGELLGPDPKANVYVIKEGGDIMAEKSFNEMLENPTLYFAGHMFGRRGEVNKQDIRVIDLRRKERQIYD